MLLPTHNHQWRQRWVTISDAIEAALTAEAPDSERIMELLRDRQQHLTAFTNVELDVSETNLDQQLAWLESMQERDADLLEKISTLMGKNSRALESYQTNKRALKRLRRESISPQRHYILTGHL